MLQFNIPVPEEYHPEATFEFPPPVTEENVPEATFECPPLIEENFPLASLIYPPRIIAESSEVSFRFRERLHMIYHKIAAI